MISGSRTVVVLVRLDHLVGASAVFHGFVSVRQANRQATQPEINSETGGRRGLGWWAAMHGRYGWEWSGSRFRGCPTLMCLGISCPFLQRIPVRLEALIAGGDVEAHNAFDAEKDQESNAHPLVDRSWAHFVVGRYAGLVGELRVLITC